jgi:hypothetical protein
MLRANGGNERRSGQPGVAAKYMMNNVVSQLLNLLRQLFLVERGWGGDSEGS